jgi:hypothetical protein
LRVGAVRAVDAVVTQVSDAVDIAVQLVRVRNRDAVVTFVENTVQVLILRGGCLDRE